VGGPPARVLVELLITSHRKCVSSYETFIQPLFYLAKMAFFINYIFISIAAALNQQHSRKAKKRFNEVG
jgi:hypothetical protein